MGADTDPASFIACYNSKQKPVRGTLLNLSAQAAVFETYNPYSLVQLSEILTDFRIVIGDRSLYTGRAVVSKLVSTRLMLVVEVTLVDPWSKLDVLEVLKDKTKLGVELQKFIADWQVNFQLLPMFKALVSDVRRFLSELSIWLEQVNVALIEDGTRDLDPIKCELAEQVVEPVRPMMARMMTELSSLAKTIPPEQVSGHKSHARHELHPYLFHSPFAHRSFVKPLGFAGDYGMIDMVLGDPFRGESIFGKALNALIVETDTPQAHRNRVKTLVALLSQEAAKARNSREPFRAVDIGCGPGQDVCDFITSSPDADHSEITLVDFCSEALEFAQRKAKNAIRDTGSKITLKYVENSIDMLLRESLGAATSRSFAPGSFHMIYCAGLFDYFVDPTVRRLISLFYDWLVPGGLLVVTNVHPKNPQKAFMEYLLEWNVIHRDEDHFLSLADTGGSKRVFSEDTGINIFLTIRKPEEAT